MVIVLKPLEAAIRDQDHVYATVVILFVLANLKRYLWIVNIFQILGTGVNSSGALVPANAPAAVAQRDAMLRAFGQAARSPQDVDFIELHATGTNVPLTCSQSRSYV